MRETKFRAWDIEEKGFIAGFNMTNYHSYYNKGLKQSIKRYSKEWIEGDYILEQFIGLKDKKGVEIYEGDIVKFEYEDGGYENSSIHWCSVQLRFKIGIYGFSSTDEDTQKRMEVVGNIHQN